MMRRLASPRFVVRLICIVIVTKLFIIVYEWLIDVESGMLICIFRFLIMLLGMSSSLFYPFLLACSFYRAMLCIRGTSHGPVSLCVRLSEVGVLLKRLNVGSHKQHHAVAQGL